MAISSINSERLLAKLTFPYNLKRVTRYKKIGYNMAILRQTSCIVVNPIIMVDGFATSFIYFLKQWKQ